MSTTYSQIHRFGTQAQYDALAEKNPDYLYFTSDTGKLYKGTIDYTNSLISVSAVPATGVAGKIYLETTTGQVKAYINGAWVVISYPIVSEINADNASTAKVTSEAAVVNYVESAIGTGAISNIEQKMNAGTAVAGTIMATKGDGSTFDVHFTGVSVNPSWDAETRVLTLPVVNADGTTTNVTANIGKDIFLDPTPGVNYFDSETKEIVLQLNDNPEDPTIIRIPASALYNDYTGGTTNSGTVAIDATSHAITFNLNINSAANNALTLDANGLMVDLSAYATTEALEGVRSSLQGQIDSTTATLAATTAALGTLENNYNATTAELDTLKTNYNATTAALDTLTTNYNATTAELGTLEGNYNATTAELNTLKTNYNATTAALDTLTTNYNATTVQVAANTEDIAALATAATTWAGFTD